MGISVVESEQQTNMWLGWLTYVTETGTHDDSLVAVLFVVVEDLSDRYDTRVFVAFIVLASRLLVPVEDLFGRNELEKKVSHMLEKSK